MHTDFLLDVFRTNPDKPAIVWRDHPYTYRWLLDAVVAADAALKKNSVSRGAVVSLEADFSRVSVAMLLALIGRSCVCVPLTNTVREKKAEFRAIGEIEVIVRNYLLKHPEVLEEAMAELSKRQSAAEAEKHAAGVTKNAEAIFNSPRGVTVGARRT